MSKHTPFTEKDLNEIIKHKEVQQAFDEIAQFTQEGVDMNSQRTDLAFYTPPQLQAQLKGFTALTGGDGSDYDIAPEVRTRIVKLARSMKVFNPLVKHTVGLFRMFSVGCGIKFSTTPPQDGQKSKQRNRKSRAEQVFENFSKSPLNRNFMSFDGQEKMVEREIVDGEVFLAMLFPKNTSGSNARIRAINPLEIELIVTNPEDAEEVWFYVRRFKDKLNNKSKVVFYKHWAWEHKGNSIGISEVLGKGEGIEGSALKGYVEGNTIRFADPVIYSMRNGLGTRGVSHLSASLPWANAYRRYMESRLAVMAARARHAREISAKGTRDDIASIKSRLESGIKSTSDYTENNPPNTAGADLLHSPTIELKNIDQDTGAESAKVDGNMIITMYCAGVDLFPHWMGAGEAFRLATASSMEPPIRKLFSSYQTKWEQAYTDIIKYLFSQAGVPKEQQFVRVDFPELWSIDVPELIEAMARMFQSSPWLAEIDEVVLVILMHLGIENPRQLWDGVREKINQRIEKMNDERVIGPNGGQSNASASDDNRTPQPGKGGGEDGE